MSKYKKLIDYINNNEFINAKEFKDYYKIKG